MNIRRFVGDGRGRPYKGPREFLGFRIPVELAEEIRIAADKRGCSLTDYVGDILAEAHRHPAVSSMKHTKRGKGEGELPLARSA